MAGIEDKLRSIKDFHKAAVFDQEGKVLGATFETDAAEIKEFLRAWDDRDTTVGKGLVFGANHFDVHRWYDRLVYGRRGDAERGEGICLCRTKTTGDQYVYAVITYVFPTISARAIPILTAFADENRKFLVLLSLTR
jgi:hypothetical protein